LAGNAPEDARLRKPFARPLPYDDLFAEYQRARRSGRMA
jgi:hypothetical protein